MILTSAEVKRLGIFCVYDKDGIIDDYIIVLLRSIRRHLSKILVVCNGALSSAGSEKLSQVADEILVRKKNGFDAGAYKEGMEYIGWSNLGQYDEVVLFNDTIMGPVNSFENMFEDMKNWDLDFWGITKHYKVETDLTDKSSEKYISEYIQSYFICIRKKMLLDKAFIDYWKCIADLEAQSDAISKYQTVFTKKFSDLGYKWQVYVNTDDLEYMNADPLMYMTTDLVKNRKCPVFMRNMFFEDYTSILLNTMGNTVREFLDYLNISRKYDINLIWDNLLRTCNQEDIVRSLSLRYILSSSNSNLLEVQEVLKKRKIALVMHLYFEDLIMDMCQYASYMPKEVDIYITTKNVELREIILNQFTERIPNKIEVRIIQNRGRDISSILVGVKDIVPQYDYICFVHDKKAAYLKPGTVGSGFASKCFNNIIFNKTFVENVLCLLENNPRLGILSPPPPNHSDYFGSIGNEWGPNFEITKQLADRLDIRIPIDENKSAIAPYGTLFWFRTAALKKLYEADWEYTDFPEEPNANDGTLLHAIERIYPLVVQNEGYYPAILMSDYYAGIECTNLDYYVRTFNNRLADIFGYSYHFKQLERLSEYKNIRRELERIKGEKFELELKTLETMEYIEGLQNQIKELNKQMGLRFRIKKKIKMLFGNSPKA
ncbi:MAG: rhamnan synthesis protein F [Lachnospiraceae bacterium]|nr:rhamnan synthesis protein F [Lachnospiraceae bacterium]